MTTSLPGKSTGFENGASNACRSTAAAQALLMVCCLPFATVMAIGRQYTGLVLTDLHALRMRQIEPFTFVGLNPVIHEFGNFRRKL